jgi:hypothetical protein
MAYHYKPLLMTSEMQLTESEATLEEAEHNKKIGGDMAVAIYLQCFPEQT